ncbi:hypothetical protein L3X38_024567 [Prunus dulcis]|uniref:Uncharacterized protein n=1 Tax=Prunus dulcis TaxID=3755 RepID=A0AAD4Z6M0_PRUDU|nr:hypothetical protein L3X38_024567 [Prunus dulcis]
MCSCLICRKKFVFTNLAHLVGQSLPLISFSSSKINQHSKINGLQEDSIRSRDERPKRERLLLKRRFCWGRHPEQGQGDIRNSTCYFHTDSSQGERCSPKARTGYQLGLIGQKKNTSRADERNSRSEGRSFSGSKNSREHSLSPISDADSSTGSYHGSPPDDQQKKLTLASVGESYSMAMQVMVTGAMSIEEQLAHMSEAITQLTKMVEEKDAQIASLINNKWEGHQDKEPGQDAHKKGPHHEAESREKRLGHETESGEKPHGKDANVATIVFGSFEPVLLPSLSKNWNSNQQGAYTR